MKLPSRAGQTEARLVTGPVGKTLWDLSWPMTMGLFSVIAFNIVDTFYIGLLGSDELAAISFCFPVIFMMGAIAIGLGNGAVSLVSRALGENNQGRARRLTTNTMMVVLIYTFLMMAIMYVFSNRIFALLGTPPHLMPHINSYMSIWYAGLPFLILPIVGNSLIRANGEALFPSVLMVIAAAINAILSPLLMFGPFGLPALGMAGAAWATIIARGSIAIVAIYYLGFRKNMMEVSWRAVQAFPRHVGSIFQYGAPATLAQLVSPVSTAIVVAILADFSAEAVAGFTVGTRIETLMVIPFFAFQSGISPFMGQNIGANKPQRLVSAQGWIWKFSVLWGLFSFVVLTAFGGAMGGLFSKDPQIIELTDSYLAIVSAAFVFAGLFQVSTGVFNPLGKPLLGMGLSALRYLVLFAGSALLIVHTDLLPGLKGPEGVFYASAFAWVVAGALSAGLMHYYLKSPRGAAVSPPGDSPHPYQHHAKSADIQPEKISGETR